MGKKVLAVDDDRVMLEFLRTVLCEGGYETTCASGGQEAIDILRAQRFDCVLLDFDMPEKDGVDVCGSMFRRKDRTPTIIFTSKIEVAQEACMRGLANVTDTLKKPCSMDRILASVARAT